MSTIEWTDETWNPTVGCSRVSPGCDHCYAEKVAHRQIIEAHKGLTKMTSEGIRWTGEVRCLPDRLETPLRWRKPRRVFVDSMSDLFHPDVPDGFIMRVLDVIYRTPEHTYQVLTKRPQRMAEFMRRWVDRSDDHERVGAGGHLPPMPRGPDATRATYSSGRSSLFAAMLDSMGEPPPDCAYPTYDWQGGPRFWPEFPHNLWLGVSVENQRYADLRIPHLLATPATVRFLSIEPMLGPVDLRAVSGLDGQHGHVGRHHGIGTTECPREAHHHCDDRCSFPIDWVIAGGESGPGARPMHPQWARDIRDQCTAAGVPFFFKQWGGWAPFAPTVENTRGSVEFLDLGDGDCLRRVGKKRAGRVLDGRTWDETP